MDFRRPLPNLRAVPPFARLPRPRHRRHVPRRLCLLDLCNFQGIHLRPLPRTVPGIPAAVRAARPGQENGTEYAAPALLEVWDPPAEEDPVWHAIWRQEYVIDLMRQARGQFDGKTLTAFERHGRAGEASQTVAKDLEHSRKPSAGQTPRGGGLRTRLDHE